MRTLITGGAGFIGSHISAALCKQGARVIVLDNLSSGLTANLGWLQPGDRLEFVQGDIRDATLVRRLLTGCHWVFHQAAIASMGSA